MEEKIKAKVIHTIFNNKNYYILNTDRGRVKGFLFDYGTTKLNNMIFEFEGVWKSDKYGDYFEFRRAKLVTEHLFFFLSKVVKGIGEVLAKELLEKYGQSIVDIIEKNPRELLNVRGIGEKKLQQIINSWNKYIHLKNLTDFLYEADISINLVIKIYNRYGERSIEKIKENPYCITQIHGIGFKTADRIALKLGVNPNSEQRILAYLEYILSEESVNDGHSHLPINDVIKKIREEIELPDTIDILKLASGDKRFKIVEDCIGLSYIYKKEKYIYNSLLTRKYKRGMFLPNDVIDRHIKKYEQESGIILSKEQVEAVYTALKYNTCAIVGYAGTGKTTVAKVFVQLLKQKYGNSAVVGCALSGIAARRLEDVTGIKAYTIHSLLDYDGDKFRKNDENPLEYDVVIVDECGMINVSLFWSLLRAIKDNTILILIGDNAQLPPIGVGNVFSDIIENEIVKTVRLTTVYRQSSDSIINVFAQNIRQGVVPYGYKSGNYVDWSYIDVSPHDYWNRFRISSKKEKSLFREELNDTIIHELEILLRNYKDKIKDIIYDLQVLIPQRAGILGYEQLNDRIQNILNPHYQIPDHKKIERNGRYFCIGDKIIHLENKNKDCIKRFDPKDNYLSAENIYKKKIFNGTLGVVKSIDHEKEIVICYMSTGDFVIYDFIEMGDIVDLAYALTVHKAQGSEFGTVILPLSLSNYIMLQNQWLYTAVTRARKKVIIISEDLAFKIACKNENKKYRRTWISLFVAQKLQEAQCF